jgi:ubiquinone/menaquinone biosynthesis C-methylase UbiE
MSVLEACIPSSKHKTKSGGHMDNQKAEAFAERILTEVNGAMSVLNIYLGHKLGLYRSLADAGDITPKELARRTGYSERYLREWLECMAVSGYLDYSSVGGSFSLSDEHRAVLVEQEHPSYITPFTQWIPSFAGILAHLMEAFRTGGGVDYELYGQDTLDAIGLGNRPMFANDYVNYWLPAMPDVQIKLEQGGKVAEVGAGVGWSSISLARGFPRVKIDSVDIDAESIQQARTNVEKSGLSDRITFHHSPIERVELAGPYDLVTAFECLHDMAYPIEALEKMRCLAGSKGTVLIADEAAGDSIEENCNFLGQLFYNFSVLHCLTQAMVFPEAAGTGTAIHPSTVREYARAAGFKEVEILPIENPFWRFYRLTA